MQGGTTDLRRRQLAGLLLSHETWHAIRPGKLAMGADEGRAELFAKWNGARAWPLDAMGIEHGGELPPTMSDAYWSVEQAKQW